MWNTYNLQLTTYNSMRSAFIQLHIAVFLAGITGILGRLISLNESLIVWYRLLITVMVLWIVFAFRKRKAGISFKAFLPMAAVGGIVALHWVAFYGSIKYANVSIALVCFSTLGFFSALLEPFLLRRKMNWAELGLGILSLTGVALIFHFDTRYKTGIFFGIICAMLASLFTIFNKKLLVKHEPSTITLYELSGGFLVLTLLLPFYFKWFNLTIEVPLVLDWLWLMILAVFCTVIAFILQLNALRKISPFTVNLTYNLEPVYGILLAFAIFNENKYLTSGFYYGLGLIGLAVLLQMARVRLSESPMATD